MRFGLFLQPVHHPAEHPTVALERDLDLLVLLDKLGYDEAWIGEHHSTGWDNIAAPEIVIAAAAERTKRLKLGTGVVQLGLHHPLVALDRMILLDHLTRGRAMFGVGVGGGLPSDLAVFGLDPAVAGKRMGESLEVMMRLLTEEDPITHESDWFELHNAVLQLRPYSQPHMHFAVASTNPANVELMGRIGGSVLAGPVPERVPMIFEHLQRGASQAGVEASRDQIMLSYPMHLADSHRVAFEEFKEGAISENYDFNVAVNGRSLPEGSPDDWYESYAANSFIGTPAAASARIEELIQMTGGFGGILFTSRDWAGIPAAHRSWELFAREVAPRFGGHVGQQQRAADAAAVANRPKV